MPRLSPPLKLNLPDCEVWHCGMEDHHALAPAMLDELKASHDFQAHSHPVNGRWENTYLPRRLAPVAMSLLEAAADAASTLLGQSVRPRHDPQDPTGNAWWYNLAEPGDGTGIHDHSPKAALSGVYYLKKHVHAGHLIVHPDGLHGVAHEAPAREGDLLFFPPKLKHSVAPNASDEPRISFAFNLYPRQ